MSQPSVRGLAHFAGVVIVIGFAMATTSQVLAQAAPPSRGTPAPTASMMPMPAGSMMPMPATSSVPATSHNAEPIDALKNNPNGPAWLDKFARHPSDSSMSSGGNMPMGSAPMKKMMKSKMMNNMMKSKMNCSTSHKPMKRM